MLPDHLIQPLPLTPELVSGEWMLDENGGAAEELALRVQTKFTFTIGGTVRQDSQVTRRFLGAVKTTSYSHIGHWALSGDTVTAEFPTHREIKPHHFVRIKCPDDRGIEREALVNPRSRRPCWRVGAE